MIKKKGLLVVFAGLIILASGFRQDVPRSTEKKMLFLIGKTQRLWSQKDMRDSINWSDVKHIEFIRDSTALKEYGKKGTNGVCIIVFKDSIQ